MTRRKTRESADAVWTAFAQRHRGHPFLNEDPLYALTEPVIDALVEEVPSFFESELEWFERDLARTACHGFFLRRVIGGADSLPPEPIELLSDHRPRRGTQSGFETRLRKRAGLTLETFMEETYQPIEPSFGRLAPFLRFEWQNDEKSDGILRGMSELLAEMRQSSGAIDPVDVQTIRKQWDQELQLTHSRPEAYAGWLVTNRDFVGEVSAMRSKWGRAIERRGSFPTGPHDAVASDAVIRQSPRLRFADAWSDFYRRWGLEQMLTWELALPMIPSIGSVFPMDFRHLTGAGLTLFIPWYLSRGGELDLREVARRLKLEMAPLHLQEWIHKDSKGADDQSGDLTYQRVYWVYRSHQLVLSRRYSAACKRHVEQVDRALGTLMGRGEDLVKKLRLRLRRELQRQ